MVRPVLCMQTKMVTGLKCNNLSYLFCIKLVWSEKGCYCSPFLFVQVETERFFGFKPGPFKVFPKQAMPSYTKISKGSPKAYLEPGTIPWMYWAF